MREKHLAYSILIVVLAVNAFGLWPEISISRVDLNDNILHYTLIDRMVEVIEHRGNPFDFWVPEWSLGYPVPRTYQSLPHALVALVYFALGKSVSLMTVFVWVRFFSILLLPLSFFVCARLLALSPLTAAAASVLAPMISTAALYGLEYGSYLWAGSGLFTQAVATHFALLAIGFGFRAVREGRRLALTGLLLGLTFLSHFVYGYIAALTLCMLALIPSSQASTATRILRTAWMGGVAFLVAAFELIPMLRDGSIINHSRWEYLWKWDSFNALDVLTKLFTGELLDHGRLPVLSLLALVGAGVYFWDLHGGRRRYPARTFVIAGAALWILLLFGRTFWGPLLSLLGISADMPLHRVIGGVQIFLVLLAAVGLSAIWRRWPAFLAVGATAVILYPMVQDRARYLANDAKWGAANLKIVAANQKAIDTVIAKARERGGRAYSGLAGGWGATFKVGEAPFYAYLSTAHVPALSFLYHSMALTSDIMVRFNEWNPAQYRLFNVTTVIAPATMSMPAFLAPIQQTGPFQVLGAPGAGYFELVNAPYAIQTSKINFYDVNDRWLTSDWVGNRQHLLLDFEGGFRTGLPRLSADDALPASPALQYPGAVLTEHRDAGEVYRASIDAARPAYALFRVTWHPNWKTYVDGQQTSTAMLSPGFIGVPVTAGRHEIVARYEPERYKSVLAIAGFLITILLIVRERRGWMPQLAWTPTVPRRALVAAGVLVLALPVCVALFTSKLPEGHDAFEYVPRLAEFHENISNGILLPRWAPDLSRGAGQPLFLFNPPMIYYLAEAFHLLGFSLIASLNLACIAIVLGAAAAMFLLGRLYFGEWGGWLAATAFLYAPYFGVNLYVRSALAEFAAFPFFALALYGFGAFAKFGTRKHLLIGAAGFAGVLLSHNPAALFFTPLLAAFIAFTAWTAKSWRVFREQAAAFAIGLGIAACVWLPSLAQTKYVGVDRLLEGYLRYTNHFVYPHQLLYSPWGYGLSVAGDEDGLSFAIGWSHLLLAAVVLGWIAWTRRFGDARWLAFFAFSAVILSILMVQDAEWIWDQIKLLQYTEFPWRLLGPVSVCVALLIAPLGPLLASLKRWRVPAFAAALALLIVPNIAHLHPKQFHDVDPTLWTPAQIAWRGVDVATAGEYRPRWMQTLPPFTVEKARAADAQIRQTRRTPVSWSGEIQATNPTTVEMSIAYFPGWRVRVDAREVESRPADNTGLIRFDVPAGAHHIDVAFTRTASVWAGDLISLLCVVLFGAAALSSLRRVEHGRRLDETLARGVELAPEQRDHREYVHPNQQREPSAHAPVEHVVVGHVPDVPSKRRRR